MEFRATCSVNSECGGVFTPPQIKSAIRPEHASDIANIFGGHRDVIGMDRKVVMAATQGSNVRERAEIRDHDA